ncbi:MAG: heavy metal-responsive transcriptional regulator [Vicinamibacterales bacterium]
MRSLRVGEVAKQAGVSLHAIHYYERRGLLPTPPRTATNYRAFSPDTVTRVRFIKHAQELGFTLDEIKELLSLRARPQSRCAQVYRRTEAKVADIDNRIVALRAMRTALAALLAQCEGEAPISACPILDAMDSMTSTGPAAASPSSAVDGRRRTP